MTTAITPDLIQRCYGDAQQRLLVQWDSVAGVWVIQATDVEFQKLGTDARTRFLYQDDPRVQDLQNDLDAAYDQIEDFKDRLYQIQEEARNARGNLDELIALAKIRV